jgi:hypothetical protein
MSSRLQPLVKSMRNAHLILHVDIDCFFVQVLLSLCVVPSLQARHFWTAQAHSQFDDCHPTGIASSKVSHGDAMKPMLRMCRWNNYVISRW